MNGNKEYFIPVPDNEDSLYAFINLVINNKNNAYKGEATQRPKKIGWVNVSYTRNEVNELFVIVNNNKEKVFVEMIINQFLLLRTYWNIIRTFEVSPSSDSY